MICPACGLDLESDVTMTISSRGITVAAKALGSRGQDLELPGAKAVKTYHERILAMAAKALGSRGGSVKGKSKARRVDYSALARLSHARRAENKAKRDH